MSLLLVLSIMVARSSVEWWKREQRPGAALSMFGELLHLLRFPALRARATTLATVLLRETGLFEGCEWEIPCWFYPLCGNDDGDGSGSSTATGEPEQARAQRLFDGVEFLDAILQQARQKLLPLNDSVADAMCKWYAVQFNIPPPHPQVLVQFLSLNVVQQPVDPGGANAAASGGLW